MHAVLDNKHQLKVQHANVTESETNAGTIDKKVIGVDLQCKYMIFMPELFRHQLDIFRVPSWCIHVTRQTTIIHNTGRASAGLRSVKRSVCVSTGTAQD